MTAGARGPAPRGRSRAAQRAPIVPGSGPLARVPPVAAFVVVVAVFATGVIVGGVLGTVLLGLLAAGVVALLVATWPRLTVPERVVRLLVLAVLVALTVGLATGGGP